MSSLSAKKMKPGILRSRPLREQQIAAEEAAIHEAIVHEDLSNYSWDKGMSQEEVGLFLDARESGQSRDAAWQAVLNSRVVSVQN